MKARILVLMLSMFSSISALAAPGGLNGIQEFLTNGTFTVPAGVSSVLVEMWGGGGGGGAGVCPEYLFAPGGAGGGGAYTRSVIEVSAGDTYNITVGRGGSRDRVPAPGRDGSDSQISLGSTVLVFAGGGKGGTQGTLEHLGSPGAGGQADPNAMISHDGLASTSLQGGPGGKAYNENLTPNGVLGEGGPGTCGSKNTAGRPGYVLLTW